MQQRVVIHGKVWQYIGGLLIVSVAAQIGTLPLTLYYFGQTSNYFALTNLVVIPAAFAVLVLGIGSLAMSWCVVGEWFAEVAQWVTYGLRIFVQWIEGLPGSTTHMELSAWSVGLCYGAIGCALMMMSGKRVNWWWLAGVVGCLVGILLVESKKIA